ncbi:MAG: MBL fold metallo-hydrolase [Pseudomonadota bacterium]
MSQRPAFRIDRLSDGVTRIIETGVAPWLRCNIWHVAGRDRDLVIDTGMGLSPLKAEILRLSNRPLTAILTHMHFDHCGGAHEFDRRLGHRAEAATLEAPDWTNTLYGGGWTAAELIKPRAYPDFDPETYAVRAAPLTGYLDEGDVIDLGDRHFQVLHLPGHSPGSIGLYEVGTRTLFSGDALYDGPLLDTLHHSEPEVLRATLSRIRELAPETVHGGHYPSFGRDHAEGLIDRYLAGGNRIDNFATWMRDQVTGAAQDKSGADTLRSRN